ncbi:MULTISPECIES: hypothetical protein [Desulfosporosinus]|uniref:Uncharacterized protein n=1 Tax=Desulfosporosinus acididurans TaxID=476652 RepID=A0A0J1FPW1_9FIRM|nr:MULTISPECIES: hypothetical protein [Desulfosporosinus]KLU65372.1 hypothetical protein DEAC_c25090 [Desulfosporosinus acididurans]
MFAWISMIMLAIFLGACAVVIAASCYHLSKLIHKRFSKRDYLIKPHQLKPSHG